MNYSVSRLLLRKKTEKWQGTISPTPTGTWSKPCASMPLIWNGSARTRQPLWHKIWSRKSQRWRKLSATMNCNNCIIRRQTDFDHALKQRHNRGGTGWQRRWIIPWEMMYDQLAALAGLVPLIFPPLSSRLSSRNFSITSLASTLSSLVKWLRILSLSSSSLHSNWK